MRRVVGALAGAVMLVPVTVAASAEPRPTVAEVRRNVAVLKHQAEVASERYNLTRERLGSIDVRARAAAKQRVRQRQEVAAAREALGRIAGETYRRGRVSTLDYLLGDDQDAVLAQAGLLPTLGARQAAAVRRLQEGERRLAALETDLAGQKRKAASAQRELAAQRRTVLKKLAQAEAELDRLSADERAAVERDSPTTVSGPGEAGEAGRVSCRGTAADAPTARVRAVLEFACAQIGDAYEWGAEGPGRWDCSGLTMKAWAKAGVSLPHSSQMQADHGTRISNSALRAGDLVFFHDPISHVGIYLGNGKMVHAPQSGDVVKVAEMSRTPTAAVRL